jgi:hypothetical protein
VKELSLEPVHSPVISLNDIRKNTSQTILEPFPFSLQKSVAELSGNQATPDQLPVNLVGPFPNLRNLGITH